MAESNIAAATLARWADHPDQFVREVFGVTPDPWQDEVLKAFPHNQRIAMKACKGPGKTAVLAWLIWNFLLTRPNAEVVATSVSEENLRDCLWKELARWQGESPLLLAAFKWTKTRIESKQFPETWWCSARTWQKKANRTQQAATLSGFHAEYLLFVLDESATIPDAVMATAMAALATGTECHVVQAGNPELLEGPLYKACVTDRKRWFVVEITGDPDDPKRSTRIDRQWARDMIEDEGKDSPYVLVNVFGKFPPGGMNTLLGVEEVNAAMGKHITEDKYSFAQRRLGIDVARFGDDTNVIFPRQGLVAFPLTEMKGVRTEMLAGRAAVIKHEMQVESIFIDSTGGYGAGTEDALRLSGIAVQPVNFSSQALNPRYYNRRAEMWWQMAQWIKKGGALPKDPDLVRELTTPHYYHHNGKLRLESKEQIKKRVGWSPNKADALALTFAIPEQAGDLHVPGLPTMHRPGKALCEWDPLAEKD